MVSVAAACAVSYMHVHTEQNLCYNLCYNSVIIQVAYTNGQVEKLCGDTGSIYMYFRCPFDKTYIVLLDTVEHSYSEFSPYSVDTSIYSYTCKVH